VSYFQAVRLYSLAEVCVFLSLGAVAVLGLGEHAETVLGWTHGFGWILLCLLVAHGCRRRIFPWPLLAATVSPLGPLGSTAGLEYLARRRDSLPDHRDVPAQPAERAHPRADPAGARARGGADG
jgi:hypothetical protein